MRTILSALLCLVSLPVFAQAQTPQQIADVAKGSVVSSRLKHTSLKGSISRWKAYYPPVRTYSASLKSSGGGPLANAARMALGDQRILDGDAEEANGDTFFNQGTTLESQGDTAYSSGNYFQAEKLYRQATTSLGESEKRLQESVRGYAGAVDFWQRAIRP